MRNNGSKIVLNPKTFVDITVVLFGIWAIFSQSFAILGLGFDDLVQSIYLLVSLQIGGIFLVLRKTMPLASLPPEIQSHDVFKKRLGLLVFLVFLFFIAIVALFFEYHLPFFLAAMGYLVCLMHITGSFRTCRISPYAPAYHCIDVIACTIVALAGVCYVLFINHPNRDIAFYLDIVSTTLDYPELPLYSSISAFGFPVQLPLVIYKPQTYEILIAFLSYFTGIQTFSLYFQVVPLFMAILFAFAYLIVLKRFSSQWAWVGLLFVSFALVLWGQPHSYGRYSFTVLFLGKALFVTIFIPLLFHYTLEFLERPLLQRFFLLVCCMAVSLSITSSALIIAPLLVAVLAFGTIRSRVDSLKKISLLALLGAYPVIFILVMLLASPGDNTALEPNHLHFNLWSAVGNGYYGRMALLFFLTLPCIYTLFPDQNTKLIVSFCTASTLLFLNPWISSLMGKYIAGNFTWRIYWGLPLPLLLAIFFTKLTSIKDQLSTSKNRFVLFIGIGMLGIMFFSFGTCIFRKSCLEYPGAKFDKPSYTVARYILAHAKEKDLVLAPLYVSLIIAGTPGAPAVSSNRAMHIPFLHPYLPDNVIDRKLYLNEFVNRRDFISFNGELQNYLNQENPTFIVINKRHHMVNPLISLLKDKYNIIELAGRYIFRRKDAM